MSEVELRNRVGVFLIAAQFGILLLIMSLYFAGGFLFDEIATSVALVVPMFAVYTTAIMKHFVKTRRHVNKKSRPVTNAFAFISILIPTSFVLLIAAIIILKSQNIAFSSFDEFKTTLALLESAFAIYIGQVIYSLFQTE